jgi:hypothetical protein
MRNILLPLFTMFTTLPGISQSDSKVQSQMKDSEGVKEAFLKQDEVLFSFSVPPQVMLFSLTWAKVDLVLELENSAPKN